MGRKSTVKGSHLGTIRGHLGLSTGNQIYKDLCLSGNHDLAKPFQIDVNVLNIKLILFRVS